MESLILEIEMYQRRKPRRSFVNNKQVLSYVQCFYCSLIDDREGVTDNAAFLA